ncbi:MAG: hypothetical protein ACM3PY_05095 [Omnitrophica WOR_2 bacterium]
MNKEIIQKSTFLPALILVVIFLMLALAYGLNAGLKPLVVATPNTALSIVELTPLYSPTFTITPSATPSPRPTWTLRPSSTPTITPTPAPTNTPGPIPLLTAAKPLKFNDLYTLKKWTSADANSLVDRMVSYPDALFSSPEDQIRPEHDAYFYYAVFAAREALLRFPKDPMALHWRWQLAYSLAHLDDPQADQVYAGLVVNALDSRQATLSGLPEWFSQQEYRMQLETFQLTARPEYLSSQVVEIKANDPGGGAAYFWLLETPNGFQAFPLSSHFDFAHRISSSFFQADLTGDGSPEAVMTYSPSPGDTLFKPARVFDLSAVPPRELKFAPSLPLDFGADYQNEWLPQDEKLVFKASLFPSCPVNVTRTYQWKGNEFTFESTQFQVKPAAKLLAWCADVVTHAETYWGPEAAIAFMQTLLPDWPPQNDVHGKPYPLDAKDEWRLRIGILYALAGNQAEAKRYLQDVIAKPVESSSRWITPAQQFLAAYQKPADLYRACLLVSDCDPRQALRQITSLIPLKDYDQASNFLLRYEVTLRASGLFDFENNGKPERWFLVRHKPLDALEFWILAPAADSIRALYIDTSETNNPAPYYHEPVETPPIVQIKMKEGFILHRVPTTQEPYIEHVTVEFTPTMYTKDTLQSAIDALFSGEAPGKVLQTLVALQKSPEFNCLNYRICDKFYYTLGLAYELTGDNLDAIDAYVKLWWENVENPYTTMARLKLIATPLVTRTPTITPTRTITPTPTITNTRNPFETETVTPIPSKTPTVTITVTPYP